MTWYRFMESLRTRLRGIRLAKCLLVVYSFGVSCRGSVGNGFDCPSSIDVTNGTHLKIVSRNNQTQGSFCGASLETICFRDSELDNCRILLNLSVNLLAKDKRSRDKMVESFELILLYTSILGMRWETECNVVDLANDTHASHKVGSVNWWFDYDCCDEGQSEWSHTAIFTVFSRKSKLCKASSALKFKPERKEVSSSVYTAMGISSENISAEIPETGDKDLEKKATSLVGVVAAVVIAVAGAVVIVVVVYIVYVKCSHGHLSNGSPRSSQSEQAPLKTETQENCRICILENVKVIAPEEEDSVSYSTINPSIIPPITVSSSEEDLTENRIDSGFESILADARKMLSSAKM